MDSAIIGILAVIGIFHVLLVIIPIIQTLRAPISGQSKLAWCAFLLLFPFAGVAWFHFKFRSSLFHGKSWEPSSREIGGPPSGFTKKDRD